MGVSSVDEDIERALFSSVNMKTAKVLLLIKTVFLFIIIIFKKKIDVEKKYKGYINT